MIEKVIFCDCSDKMLKKLAKKIKDGEREAIYRGNGYKINQWLGTSLLTYKAKKYIILTNDTQFLDNQYCWDDYNKECNLYIIPNSQEPEIFQASKLVNKEIRKTHNLRRMYINGAFNFEEV